MTGSCVPASRLDPADPTGTAGSADPAGSPDPAELDAPVWHALTGAQSGFAAVGGGHARRYLDDVSPFAALDPQVPHATSLPDLAALAGPGVLVVLPSDAALASQVPAGWQLLFNLPGEQLIATDALRSVPDDEALVLGPADVDEMLDLVARTNPGPFARRTHELGRYLGIRRDGKLLAMAGERIRVTGFSEISAVCTDPAARGQGLAGRLIGAVAHEIRSRGEVPFLHVAGTNTNARRLYGTLGFELRRAVVFYGLRTPAGPTAALPSRPAS